MNEQDVRRFLGSLRRAVRQVRLYPDGHPLTDEAVSAAETAAEAIIGADGEAALSIMDDAFYLNRSLLPHSSLEFNGLLHEMQARGIETVTLLSVVSRQDLTDLAAFIAGTTGDLPADGTVRLNERPVSRAELEAVPMSGLRKSYASSLEVLRSVTGSMATGSGFELGGVVWAVEGLLEHSLTQSSASLLLATVKSHDEYTFFHSVNVCILALTIGRLVGVDDAMLRQIGIGALLHDIGKMSVSVRILQYPGRLDQEAWKEIKLHPQEGAQAIMAAGGSGNEVAANVAFEHHARFDGTGYPTVTRSGPPHIFSRLVSVVDTYDAITTRRSYRRAETPNRALNVLLNGAGAAWDPDLVRAFIRMMGVYPAGSILQLQGGDVMVVTTQDDTDPDLVRGIRVKRAAGDFIEPEPVVVPIEHITGQLLPERSGVDPSSYLEQTESLP
jgi:HD-GYP domain-containing protein (c-di-GMP phosphodiesterase class II)